METTLSVIVPIFNVEKYLDEAISSILSQDIQGLDIVLVDDGSTDKSLQIALSYMEKDPRIFVISKANGGLSSARNMGLEFIKSLPLRDKILKKTDSIIYKFDLFTYAKNKTPVSNSLLDENFTKLGSNYIKTPLEDINSLVAQEMPKDCIIHFLDSDDFFNKDCLSSCLALKDDENASIYFHNFRTLHDGIPPSGFIQNDMVRLLSSNKDYYESGLEALSFLNTNCFWFAWSGAFKACLLNSYNLRFAHQIEFEDNDFGSILFALAKGVIIDKRALMTYRIRIESITRFKDVYPKKMPRYLEDINSSFSTYGALKGYYRSFSYAKCAFSFAKFAKDSNYKARDLEVFKTYIWAFLETPLRNLAFKEFQADPLNIKQVIQEVQEIYKMPFMLYMSNCYPKIYKNLAFYLYLPSRIKGFLRRALKDTLKKLGLFDFIKYKILKRPKLVDTKNDLDYDKLD